MLAFCDFDMRFTFVLSEWLGSAHDMRVFKDAMTTHVHKFPHPPLGKQMQMAYNSLCHFHN
jgi:hypothetical protein